MKHKVPRLALLETIVSEIRHPVGEVLDKTVMWRGSEPQSSPTAFPSLLFFWLQCWRLQNYRTQQTAQLMIYLLILFLGRTAARVYLQIIPAENHKNAYKPAASGTGGSCCLARAVVEYNLMHLLGIKPAALLLLPRIPATGLLQHLDPSSCGGRNDRDQQNIAGPHIPNPVRRKCLFAAATPTSACHYLLGSSHVYWWRASRAEGRSGKSCMFHRTLTGRCTGKVDPGNNWHCDYPSAMQACTDFACQLEAFRRRRRSDSIFTRTRRTSQKREAHEPWHQK